MMAVKKKKTKGKITKKNKKEKQEKIQSIKRETVRGVWGVVLIVLALIFLLAAFNSAGRMGEFLYSVLYTLFGFGYYLVPISLVLFSVILFRSMDDKKVGVAHYAGSILFFVSSLALVETLHTTGGGILGALLSAPLVSWLAVPATILVLAALIFISLLIIFDTQPRLPRRKISDDTLQEDNTEYIQNEQTQMKIKSPLSKQTQDSEQESTPVESAKKKSLFNISNSTSTQNKKDDGDIGIEVKSIISGDYTPPPLKILRKNSGKPVVGDVKANANLIRRTLQNFGIPVEMDEVSIGPTVTRYAFKPAEGVRLGKIMGLQSNLELALAASPVRIEAPIPGKALVGIEVPNTSRTTLGLGSMLAMPEYSQSDKPLLVSLGGDISGKPHFANIAKMPHLLIAGATGAGKSVTVNNMIVSLLYRSGPSQLRLLMVDPKRVELTLYNKIPHLLTPVITDAKKAILALKWLAKEMDRRYDVLQAEAVRDIESYHKNILAPAMKKAKGGKTKDGDKLPEQMPYIVAFIDELSDLMQAYPRELEAAIVRLTQMSRAVGIHLVLATQRPSVKVITGLIKANIPTRLAMQVASQIDSRTILDMGGAEKLLGAGDMLYLSGEMSKPTRVQAPFVSEQEVKAVVSHLAKAYEAELDDEIDLTEGSDPSIFEASVFDDNAEDEDDDMYSEAKRVVIEAGKGSTSYLQRKLRVGYARAARLMDMLEEHGVVGPAEGAKPREVLMQAEEQVQASTDDEQTQQ
jgi:S-DNA-T family DNA segregation ATPase FtsK/SpoIIIE